MRRHQDVVVRTHEELAAARRLIAPDPELDAIKDYYRKPFERAITAAIAALSDRDKAVYRMHLVDGVTLQNIGRAYGVHHTTVLRWLEAARERILEETKRLLRDELKVNAAEFDSLVRLLISQLNVNVSRILGADDSK
jgi:RNA polymerase sigma-70 factor (ECF subfamily)